MHSAHPIVHTSHGTVNREETLSLLRQPVKTRKGMDHLGSLCLSVPRQIWLKELAAVMAITCWLLLAILMTSALCRTLKRQARDWCTDHLGRRRSLYEEWRQRAGHYRCRCEYPQSRLYSWNGQNPSDATPHCQLEGCRHPLNGRVLVSGDTFTNERGRFCVCRKGTDPYLMDATTLYHTDCSLVLPDHRSGPRRLDHHIPTHSRSQTPT